MDPGNRQLGMKALRCLAWVIAGPPIGALSGAILLLVGCLIFGAPLASVFLPAICALGAIIGLSAGLMKAASAWEGWGAKKEQEKPL
jgi:hypothetical protein